MTAAYARYDAALGSGSRNTVRRAGPNSVDIDIPDDDTGRALLAANESSGVIVRPYLDPTTSVFEEIGDTAIYSHAEIRSFVVSATDKRAGWPVPEIIQTPAKILKPEGRQADRWQRGGRRVCL